VHRYPFFWPHNVNRANYFGSVVVHCHLPGRLFLPPALYSDQSQDPRIAKDVSVLTRSPCHPSFLNPPICNHTSPQHYNLPKMQAPVNVIIDHNSQAYMHPLEVDALDNNFNHLRKLMNDLGMADSPSHTSARIIKLRYRLAHAGILEECEDHHGPGRINEQATKYMPYSENSLKELCEARQQGTSGDIHQLRWRLNRTDLGITKVGQMYRFVPGMSPRKTATISRGATSERKDRRAQLDRDGYEEVQRPTQDHQLEPTKPVSEHTSFADVVRSYLKLVWRGRLPRLATPSTSTANLLVAVPKSTRALSVHIRCTQL
jgi:hypothetical protein